MIHYPCIMTITFVKINRYSLWLKYIPGVLLFWSYNYGYAVFDCFAYELQPVDKKVILWLLIHFESVYDNVFICRGPAPWLTWNIMFAVKTFLCNHCMNVKIYLLVILYPFISKQLPSVICSFITPAKSEVLVTMYTYCA